MVHHQCSIVTNRKNSMPFCIPSTPPQPLPPSLLNKLKSIIIISDLTVNIKVVYRIKDVYGIKCVYGIKGVNRIKGVYMCNRLDLM